MEYTVSFLFYPGLTDVILITKNHGPDPGCLNGVGGAIEASDATPAEGALREISEETGIAPEQISQFQWLETVTKPNGNRVWYFYGVLEPGEDFTQPEGGEPLTKFPVSDATDVTDARFAGRGDVCLYIHSSLFELRCRMRDGTDTAHNQREGKA